MNQPINKLEDYNNDPEFHRSEHFRLVWDMWPRKADKKRSKKIWDRVTKDMSPNDIENFTGLLWIDIDNRKALDQFGFKKMLLSTYLNGERYKDDLPESESVNGSSIARSVQEFLSGSKTRIS